MLFPTMSIIFGTKCNRIVINGLYPVIANGNLVGISTQVSGTKRKVFKSMTNGGISGLTGPLVF